MSVPTWPLGDDPGPLVALLDRGGVAGIPTESSYGLAARPDSAAGVAAIFAIKRRPPAEALPVVIASPAQAAELGVDPTAPGLAEAAALWPAPLTVVVPIPAPLPATAGRSEIALRVPALAGLRTLLERVGPLTATSANRSGEPPLVDPADVARLLEGHEAGLVDGGVLQGGLPSTLVRWHATSSRFEILREGAYPGNLLPIGSPDDRTEA